eukprot:TRINITY_DN783_c0_g2_i1.p1 TRINITY_DN783_c0_g2~~TRINITY_DN783_c0_g2_i1.p1  ORF type:complete len:412 (+),score=109.21 TRINITY_DN783_c0_g2_i1:60-1295(+)
MLHHLKASVVAKTVEKLLLEQRKNSMEYKVFLSNHVSWVIMPLLRIGRREAEVADLAEVYNNRIEAEPMGVAGEVSAPAELVNMDNDHYAGLVNFFDDEMQKSIEREGSVAKGIEALCTEYLRPVARGIGAGAFHPVLELGLGVEGGLPTAVATGLAYMHSRCWKEHDDIEALATGDEKSLLRTLQSWCTKAEVAKKEVDAIRKKSDPYPTSGFQQRTLAMHKSLTFLREAPTVVPSEEKLLPALHDMFIFAAAAMLASDNEFFILHGFTSLWSVYHIVKQSIPQDVKEDLTAAWLRGYFAAYASQDFPGLSTVTPALECLLNNDYSGLVSSLPQVPSEASWSVCFDKTAAMIEEEHTLKAVWMMHEIAPLCPPEVEPVFLHVAHRLATYTPENRNGSAGTLRFERINNGV